MRMADSTNYSTEVSAVLPSHLSNSLALDSELLHLGEVVVKCHDVCDDGLFIWVLCEHIYKAKQSAGQPEPSQRRLCCQLFV